MELALGDHFRHAHGSNLIVSILVFVELALGGRSYAGWCTCCSVSILVFVELALGAPPPGGMSDPYVRFNPCFCGTRPRRAGAIGSPAFEVVSILVFVELALGGHTPTAGQRDAAVSILVFVELALGAHIVGYIFKDFLSFNPCFCGTRPRRLNSSIVSSEVCCFNPCFCGTRPRSFFVVDRAAIEHVFQSLFLWNSPSETILWYLIAVTQPVSILVFVELALGVRDAMGQRRT